MSKKDDTKYNTTDTKLDKGGEWLGFGCNRNARGVSKSLQAAFEASMRRVSSEKDTVDRDTTQGVR